MGMQLNRYQRYSSRTITHGFGHTRHAEKFLSLGRKVMSALTMGMKIVSTLKELCLLSSWCKFCPIVTSCFVQQYSLVICLHEHTKMATAMLLPDHIIDDMMILEAL